MVTFLPGVVVTLAYNYVMSFLRDNTVVAMSGQLVIMYRPATIGSSSACLP